MSRAVLDASAILAVRCSREPGQDVVVAYRGRCAGLCDQFG